MNTPILNREFQHPADGWYQIEAKGEHPNHQAGIVQVIDDQACAAIVNRFNADAAAGKLRHGTEMLIDHEHFADQPDKETRAYGWLQKLDNRTDGVYGQIRWTRTGKEAVDGGDYRFFSTEYWPNDLKPAEKIANSKSPIAKRMRPQALAGLSLTNMNNNRGQKPITNRTETKIWKGNFTEGKPEPGLPPGNEEFRHGPDAGAVKNTNNQRKIMKSVATRLGLSAEASEDAVMEALGKVFNRAEKAETELTPVKNRVAELEASNKTLLDEQIDALLAEHGVKEEKVINRLKPLLTPLKNRQERLDCLADLGIEAKEEGANGSSQRKLQNRETKPPKTDSQRGGSEDGAGLAQKIQNRASEIQGKNSGLKWDDCWNQAQREFANKN